MKKRWTELKKQEILSLPKRDLKENNSEYTFLLLVPTRKKHDSGFAIFAVAGMKENKELELIGYMDDFYYSRENFESQELRYFGLRFDCSLHGVIRIHGDNKFIVGINTSSTNFYFKENETDSTQQQQ
jgi:hypothetical protein